MNGPCPVCTDPGGFHDEEIHASARMNIPRHLLKAKGWQHEQGQEQSATTVDAPGTPQTAEPPADDGVRQSEGPAT